MTSIATSTLETSAGLAAVAFGTRCIAAAADATGVWRAVYGLADGLDNGRYFAGQDPLVAYAPNAGSVAALIARGTALRGQVHEAAAAMIAAAAADPASFAASVTAAVEAVRQSVAAPADALRILTALAEFVFAVPAAGSDALGQQLAEITAAASVLMRRAAAIALALATADYVPTSQQDAQAVRDAVGDVIENVAEEAANRFEDASYHALAALRVAVVTDLTARGASLAPVLTRTLPQPLPACVVAYRLYRDADRAGDLVARNDPPHPGFLRTRIEAMAG